MNDSEAPNLVIARLLDYFGRRTDWQRRLWNPGTVTAIAELIEALRFLESGHLREKTVADLARTAKRRAGPDLGVGTDGVRSALNETLKAVPKDALGRYKLEHLMEAIKPNYLGRWSAALAAEPGRVGTEIASRLLASHLLGLGFSPENLHRWATWLRNEKDPESLAEVFAAAEEVAQRQPQVWEVLIPFSSIERHHQVMPNEWMEAGHVDDWPKERPSRIDSSNRWLSAAA